MSFQFTLSGIVDTLPESLIGLVRLGSLPDPDSTKVMGPNKVAPCMNSLEPFDKAVRHWFSYLQFTLSSIVRYSTRELNWGSSSRLSRLLAIHHLHKYYANSELNEKNFLFKTLPDASYFEEVTKYQQIPSNRMKICITNLRSLVS